MKKQLQAETYHPSFSARNVFCKSRFRDDAEQKLPDDKENEEGDFRYFPDSSTVKETRNNVLLKVMHDVSFMQL